MVLESTWDDTAKDILEGIFAFITPVMTLTDGLCVASTRCMPAALAIWASLQMQSSTSLEQQKQITILNRYVILL